MPTLEYVLKVRAELQADASVEQTTELYEMFNQNTPFCEDCEDCGDWHHVNDGHSTIYCRIHDSYCIHAELS